MKFYTFATVFFLAACYVSGLSCIATNGDQGNCVTIHKCAPLLETFNSPNRSPADVKMLQRSACGFEGKIPKVCCPISEGITKGNCRSRVTALPPDPRTECCGLDLGADRRIIGGETETEIDQYPWLTLIEYLNSDNKIKLMCGGALISNYYVITAAHCLVGRILNLGTPKNVRLGEYDTNHKGPDCVTAVGGGVDCTEDIITIPIDRTIPHPEYNPLTNNHDIGLIRMQQAAPYTDFIKPICLPTVDITIKPPSYFKLFAAGWGGINSTQSVKLQVGLPFVSQDECQAAYNVTTRQVSLTKGQICAGGEIGKDSCKGDSGGPLMYQNGRFYEVVGVASFGTIPCGLDNVPGVYSKVIEYVDWIKSNNVV